MKPTPWSNLSLAGKISRKTKDIAWEVVRGVGNGVVMAPKNLVHQIRGEYTDIEWIASRKRDRETQLERNAPENVDEGSYFRPSTNFSLRRLDDTESETSVQAPEPNKGSSESGESADVPHGPHLLDKPNALFIFPDKSKNPVQEMIAIELGELEIRSNEKFGRSMIALPESKAYAAADFELFNQDALCTRRPVLMLSFPGRTREGNEARRNRALDIFVRDVSDALARPITMSDFDGIQCVEDENGMPAIAVNYALPLAQFIKHYLGFVVEDEGKGDVAPDFASIANPACAELAQSWMKAIKELPNTAMEGGQLSSICNEHASREEYAKTVELLMRGNFLVGESHNHFAARNFIEQNMTLFRDRGFTTLYMENLPIQAQSSINEYIFGDPPTQMPPDLELLAEKLGLMPILVAAKQVGMRVVGVDSMLTSSTVFGEESDGDDGTGRLPALNALALRVIEGDAQNRGVGKYLGLFGFGHVDKNSGVARALQDCMSVFVFDIRQSSDYKDKSFVLASSNHRFTARSEGLWPMKVANCNFFISSRDYLRMSLYDGNVETRSTPYGVSPHEKPLFATTPWYLTKAIMSDDYKAVCKELDIDRKLVRWTNKQGKTPADLAVDNGKFEALRAMQRYL